MCCRLSMPRSVAPIGNRWNCEKEFKGETSKMIEEIVDDEPLVRPRFHIKLAKPLVTQVLIAIIALVFVGEIAYGYAAYGVWSGPTETLVLVEMGAKVNQLITAGQYWRLFTAMFLHIGVMHLLFNLYALYAIGSLIEAYYGHARFACIYVLSGLYGSLFSYAFSPSISAGASGAIFGITAAAGLYFFRYRDNFGARGRSWLQNIVFIIVLNLVFGAVGSGVDNWGHFGGLVGGALVAWGLLPRYKSPSVVVLGDQPLLVENRLTFEIIWVFFCSALLVACVLWLSNMRIEQFLQ
jgi:membrane associated rhomboid family serine protease